MGFRPRIIVAIDGPAGAGKSSTAKALANRLSFRFLDTGAIYRALALQCRLDGIAWQDEDAVARRAEELPIRFVGSGTAQSVLLGNRDVTGEIRESEISRGASIVSQYPGVRGALLALQRRLARGGGVVAEGRDMGTVVFPQAQFKFFLTARPEIRARRRTEELVAKGRLAQVDEVQNEMNLRDAADSGRAVAPLKPAEDAILVDSTDLALEDVVSELAGQVEKLLGRSA